MNKTMAILLTVFVFISCSKEEKMELYNPEAFAFELDNGYELNASVRLKGFVQNEKDDIYKANLSYNIDIITPEGDTLKNADNGVISNEKEEEAMDLAIELQVEFDSSFTTGKYIIVYRVRDNLKPQSASLADTVTVGE